MVDGSELLRRIEEGALDSRVDLADLLRLCIALGGASGSERIRRWANAELKGYEVPHDVPPYRRLGAALLVDGQTGPLVYKAQQVSHSVIPEWAANAIQETVYLTQGVGELAALARREPSESVHFAPARGIDVVAWINANKLDAFEQWHRMYYSVSPSSILGVLDHVRTILVEMIAEMKSRHGGGFSTPSSAMVDRAVDIAVGGSNNSVVLALGDGAAAAQGHGTRSRTRVRKRSWLPAPVADHPVLAVMGVIAGVVGAVATVIAIL